MTVSLVKFDGSPRSLGKAIGLYDGFEKLSSNDKVPIKPNNHYNNASLWNGDRLKNYRWNHTIITRIWLASIVVLIYCDYDIIPMTYPVRAYSNQLCKEK